MPKQVSEYPFY